MIVRRLALASVLGFGLAAPGLAQDNPPATPPADAAPAAPAAAAEPPKPVFPPEHLSAAVDFLRVSGATRGFEELIPQYLDRVRLGYVAQRPEIAQMINDVSFSLIPEFVKRRDDLNAALAELYAAKFSVAELQELTAFYSTDVGKKLSNEQVTILQQSVPVVDRWSRELTQSIAKRIAEEVGKKGQKL